MLKIEVFVWVIVNWLGPFLDTLSHTINNIRKTAHCILKKLYDVCTAKNTVISSNFLVCKFCEEKQFPHSFGRFAYLPVQSYVIFSRNIIERVYLTKQKSKIFKVKYTVNFRCRGRKKVTKIKENWKHFRTRRRIPESRIWNMLNLPHKDRSLWQMAFGLPVEHSV